MHKYILAAAMLLSIGAMAGCGSSGSSTPTTSTVTGKVADGYLSGAVVFMDKNGNYQLDSGEPSTTTDQNGAYTLNVDPADIGLYPIVAIAVKGQTIDMDNPTQTLTYSYLLSLPKESVSGTVSSNFISPVSSELREMTETGTYTMEQAMIQLRTRLGLQAGTDVLADYMADQANSDFQTMHTAARNMTALMGSQMNQIMAAGTTGTQLMDVNRYRAMMGTIFGNMSTLRIQTPDPAMIQTMTTTMTANLGNMPAGTPYRNMSTSFRCQ